MRCFVSVNLEDKPLINKIIKLQKDLVGMESGIKAVSAENLHYTLRFLGEIDQKTVNKAIDLLKKISYNQFDIELNGLGVFPDMQMIRVIWVGSPSRGLVELAGFVNSALGEIGKNNDSFLPHLTIARVKYMHDRSRLLSYVSANRNTVFGSFRVVEFNLMQSELKPEGPRYTAIKKFDLINRI
ncbi:MAG: RNA 2',3'-cyclic phosphodiesterase [Conexivisphaerales archaeon]